MAKETKTSRVAFHAFVDANGNQLKAADLDEGEDVISLATGIYYRDLETNQDVVYQVPGAVAGSAQTMLALFGARTKAGNTASSARQARKAGTGEQTDIEAVMGFFSELDEGSWPRKEGARGPRYDDETIVAAVCEVARAGGAEPDEAKIADRVANEEGYKTKAMRNPQVAAAYHKLKGRDAPSVDDLV